MAPDVERSRGLPPALVDQAATQVSRVALAAAVAMPVLQLGRAAVQPAMVETAFNPINRLVLLAAVLVSLGIVAARTFRLAPPSMVLRLGAVLQVAVALALSMVETATGNASGPAAGVSAVGPWLVIYSGLVPGRPERRLAGALAAASAWPLAYALNAARGIAPAAPALYLLWPLINYAMAGVTWFLPGPRDAAAADPEDQDDVGGYHLESRIGEGGMGEVWKASHKLLARAAAVKIIRPEVVSEEGRAADTAAARFRREANAIARLQSPHTVYLYDFGVAKDGRFYYVMELLDGISLQALVHESGPLPAARVVAVLLQMCESLHEAHERGLVHRDLKPSNIMLCRVAFRDDFVKVLDFGLAKTVSGDSATTQLTIAGTTTGTPAYMAPEIALAEESIDRRADIYALGCIAYYLLTGTTVFVEENPTRMALLHVQRAPDSPSTRTRMPIPAALEQLVLECLAKSPTDRPPSMAAIAERLAASGVEAWTAADARDWWQANRA
jgi:serine/threonine-protein kinase